MLQSAAAPSSPTCSRAPATAPGASGPPWPRDPFLERIILSFPCLARIASRSQRWTLVSTHHYHLSSRVLEEGDPCYAKACRHDARTVRLVPHDTFVKDAAALFGIRSGLVCEEPVLGAHNPVAAAKRCARPRSQDVRCKCSPVREGCLPLQPSRTREAEAEGGRDDC